MFTLEDELDEIDRELGVCRRAHDSVLRAPSEGRWCRNGTAWMDRCAYWENRIRRLEKARAEYFAERIAAAEGFGL